MYDDDEAGGWTVWVRLINVILSICVTFPFIFAFISHSDNIYSREVSNAEVRHGDIHMLDIKP